MNIREYLQKQVLVTDGAMGTYYARLTDKKYPFAELANIYEPEVISQIHLNYIEAGAKLIKTNTFSANRYILEQSPSVVRQIITDGYRLAKQAADKHQVFVGCSIGPIPNVIEGGHELTYAEVIAEYKSIVDLLLDQGAEIFIFETCSTLSYAAEMAEYIKQKQNTAFVIIQFAPTITGHTRKGVALPHLFKQLSKTRADAYGLNCGVGPVHLYNMLTKLNFNGAIIAASPNAGYPEVINERTVYVADSQYFAEIMSKFPGLGVKIIGGCCGTTPEYIKAIIEKLPSRVSPQPLQVKQVKKPQQRKITANVFQNKIKAKQFVISVELDPPVDVQIDKILKGADRLQDKGVDLITIADSPLAKARMDAIIISCRIHRELGIDTMPHICCRDRNGISLRAGLLGAYCEGIRNILAVTGDPVPQLASPDYKGVFNLNSLSLIELITEMNRDVFSQQPVLVGGALNLNVENKQAQVKRMHAKITKGARLFLTQPLFEQENIEFLKNLHKPEGVFVLAGVMPLVSHANALFLDNEVPGINIPKNIINRFRPNMNRSQAQSVGIDLAAELIDSLKNHVDGLYIITPFNRVKMIEEIISHI